MRFFTVLLLLSVVLTLSSCKKDDPASSNGGNGQYTNKLTLGTAANLTNFTLTGEGSSFALNGGAAIIWYRLESAADLGGAGVTVKLERQTGSTYTLVTNFPYANPQNYGHIIISTFVIAGSGTYRATGMLTGTSTVIAAANFIVQ